MINKRLLMIAALLPTLGFAAPSDPSDLQLEAISSTSVSISWQDNSADETGFKIYRNDAFIAILEANSNSFVDTGLIPNTTYKYTVKATDDTNNGNLNPIIGNINIESTINSIKTSADGTKAFIAGGWNRSYFATLDLSNPAVPQILSTIEDPESRYGSEHITLSSDEKRAFTMSDQGFGLKVFDISNVSTPQYLTTIDKGGYGEVAEVSMDGHTAYVLDQETKVLSIYNISDANNKELDSTITVPNLGGSLGIKLSQDGKRLYIASMDGVGLRLSIIDIQNPSQPTILSNKIVVNSMHHPEDSLRLALSNDGNTLYSFTQHTAYYIQIMDISDPTNPQNLVQDQDSDELMGVNILSNDNIVYDFTYMDNYLDFYKLDDTYKMILVGEIKDHQTYGHFIGISNDYKKAYFVKSESFYAVDIASENEVSLVKGDGVIFVRDVTISNDGKTAYIPTSTGIKVIDKTLF